MFRGDSAMLAGKWVNCRDVFGLRIRLVLCSDFYLCFFSTHWSFIGCFGTHFVERIVLAIVWKVINL